MPEIHFKKPRFTYSACGTFPKKKERTEKSVKTGNTTLLRKMIVIKLAFNMIMIVVNKKNLTKRTQSDQFLRDKAFEVESDSKFDSYQRGLASIVCKFLDKRIYWHWCKFYT